MISTILIMLFQSKIFSKNCINY